ncbi:MAG: DUF1365 domain-containing protein [Actinomycetota bacterium]|jgi:DUF1365 family protein|nr:DUF1365 domain-containing protein [Actinomycetota bacterium]
MTRTPPLHPAPAAVPGPGAPAGGLAVTSGVYRGQIVHRRRDGVAHGFRRTDVLPFIRLDEVDRFCDLHPWWSARHRAPVHFRRQDFLGDPSVPLADAVRDVVAERTGNRPGGPVAMLGHVRTFGVLFNPITCYYCYDAAGTGVEAMVFEVENTPWHERRATVVGPPGDHVVAKDLHVSPFLPDDLVYHLHYSEPGERLTVRFDVRRAGTPVFVASMALHRSEADRSSLGRAARHGGWPTLRVTAGIYAEAFRLWRAGATFVPHPDGARPRWMNLGAGRRRHGAAR